MNKETFREYYKKYYPLSVHKFREKGFPLEDAREQAQEVFLKAYRKLHQLRSDEEVAFLAWLNAIILSAWKNRIRALNTQKRTAEVVALEEIDLPESENPTDPEWSFIQKASLDNICSAIKQLPEPLREVLISRVVHGLSYDEMARLLGRSLAVVRNQLYEARMRLREMLGEHVPVAGGKRRAK